MRPGSSARALVTLAEKRDGPIPEDHPGRMKLGQAALFPPERNLPTRLGLDERTVGQFIMYLRVPGRDANGKQLHAIVDLSRTLGYSG